ncbi:MAG: ATP-grasp domain-containing protein [Ekhidna sp.]|uniref:ATP-grasp domain-containing protein n=1 Tax=Ekhidna sp. TaxID=2608089 RepID=UPI0032EB42A2
MSKSILVTGIGGVVGQGILRNVKSEFPDIRLIGTNTVFVSAGNHLCDEVYKVPFGDSEDYISEISRIAELENINLIIPATDLEAYHLGKNQEILNVNVAISSPDLTGLSLDKWKTYQRLSTLKIPFAQSFLPGQYKGELDQVVVKPRSGRGSRDIHINPINPSGFSNDFVIQEYLEGLEITTTFYVTRRGDLHGFITFIRELDAGNTSKAEVTFEFNSELESIILQLIKNFDCRGSINLQSKVTKKGIIPFEINSRISGTNSLRPHFGFKDVRYTVQEWLFKTEPDTPEVRPGCAMRVIHDIIYPDISLAEIKNNKDNFRLQ